MPRPRPKKNEHLLELARHGAQARLSDLLHEIRLLVAMFPHLKDTFDKDELPIPFLLKKGARSAAARVARLEGETEVPVKKTRNLSPAARRAISNAQKKRWAAHRANAAKKA